jgi:hypothetical protein
MHVNVCTMSEYQEFSEKESSKKRGRKKSSRKLAKKWLI